MKMPETVEYRVPTYPGWWRSRLWRITRGRIARPVWRVFVADDVRIEQGDESGQFVVRGGKWREETP